MYGTLITIIINGNIAMFDYCLTEQKIIDDTKISLNDDEYISVKVFRRDNIGIMHDYISTLQDTGIKLMTENILMRISDLLKTEQYE